MWVGEVQKKEAMYLFYYRIEKKVGQKRFAGTPPKTKKHWGSGEALFLFRNIE